MPLPLDLKGQPSERVMRQLVAALLYEGVIDARRSMDDGLTRFTWMLGGRSYRCSGSIGPFGRIRPTAGSIEVQEDDGNWVEASMAQFVAALPGTGITRGKLLGEMKQTIGFSEWNDRNIPPRHRRLMSFAALEGALDEGHPYHPCYKARTGFSDADHSAYGPETGKAFQLVWLLVARKHLRHSLPDDENTFWSAELGKDTWAHLRSMQAQLDLSPTDFGFVPMHPWQWRNLAETLFAGWIAAGEAYCLGPAGDRYTATQSVRSLLNMDRPLAASIKLPLNMINTSSRRTLEPHSVCTAPALSRWIGGIVADDPLFHDRYPLTILQEYAGIIADADGTLAGQIGTIWRESAQATLLPGEAVIPFNALMMVEADGKPFADDWIARFGLMPWINRLIEISVLPVWHLLVHHGIAVEAHGQNMLLVHREGWPVRLILRDFHDSMEFSPAFLREPEKAPDFLSLNPVYRDAEPDQYYWTDNLDSLRELVMDTLFVYNLTEISHLLDHCYDLPEGRFWQQVKSLLSSYAGEHDAADRQTQLGYDQPHILTESLMTRKLFVLKPEYHHTVPNAFSGSAETKEKAMIRIDDRLYDHAYFEEASARLAEQTGLLTRDGGRYAVCFAETADWLSLFFAIRKAGASVLPIHPGTPYPAARKLAIGAGCDRLFYNSLSAEVLEVQAIPATKGQLLQMSSGTTGAPKCVARSWDDIDAEIESYVKTFREPETMTPVIACPTTHSYGLICGILVALKRGQTPVIVNTANPKYLLKVLRETDRPLLYSSPAILHTLARLLPEGEQIHATMTSGTLLPDAWFSLIRARSLHMFQQYGCSESGCIAINSDVTATGDMGFILPHLTAETGTSTDDTGEIVVRAADGIAVHTRDLGYIDENGMLVFISRMDDMINVSGLNVYPKDVEDAVMIMPAVTDAVAFRKSDRFAGERVALLFSAREPVAPHAVREWCSRNLASHQLPMEILQIDAVPRQANGKISRRDVAARHAAGEFSTPIAGAAS